VISPSRTGFRGWDCPRICFRRRIVEQNRFYIRNPGDAGSSIFPIYDTLYWLNQDQKTADIGVPVTDLPREPPRTGRGGRVTLGDRHHIVSLDLNGQVLSPRPRHHLLQPLPPG
jgi:hypothetical protein